MSRLSSGPMASHRSTINLIITQGVLYMKVQKQSNQTSIYPKKTAPLIFQMAMIILAYATILLGSCTSIPSQLDPLAEISFRVVTPNDQQEFRLSDLKENLEITSLSVDDPVYQETKMYEGFWLHDLLAYAGLSEEIEGDTVRFQAADGYEIIMPYDQFRQVRQRGLVAFRDIAAEREDWIEFPRGKDMISPAPFYLVWQTPSETGAEEVVPSQFWPYQLVQMEVINFAETYDRIFPSQVEETSLVYRGFLLFEAQCLHCHSINLQGGNLGPELNIPMNITEYRTEDILIDFIKDATRYRANSLMPPFEEKLTDEQINDILGYLTWMRDHKWTETEDGL